MPAPPQEIATARGRVERHLQILAVLWLIWSALRLIPGIGLLFFGSFAMPFLPFGFRHWVLPIAAFAGVFFLASAAAGFLGGWGLMERRPWARILTIVLGVLSLIHLPFGAALGIYSLWVLLPTEAEADYRRISGAV